MQFQSCTETIQFPFAQPVLSTILRRQKMAHEKTNSILNHCAANWTFTIRMGYGSLLTLFLLIGKPPKLWNETEHTENSSSNLNGHLKVIWLSGAGEYVSGPLRCTFFWRATKRASFVVDTRIEFNFHRESKIWTVKTLFTRMIGNEWKTTIAQHFQPLAFTSQAKHSDGLWKKKCKRDTKNYCYGRRSVYVL